MRHLKDGRKLNRERSHRDAMLNNMLESLFLHERIQTTESKAKELRRVSERIITRAKENTLHNKRIVLRRMHDRDLVAKLFEEIAPKYRHVHGGYTRIIRLGKRKGDGAELSIIELIDVEDQGKSKAKEATAPKKTVKPKGAPPQPKKKTEASKTKADREKPTGSRTVTTSKGKKTTEEPDTSRVEKVSQEEGAPGDTKTAGTAAPDKRVAKPKSGKVEPEQTKPVSP